MANGDQPPHRCCCHSGDRIIKSGPNHEMVGRPYGHLSQINNPFMGTLTGGRAQQMYERAANADGDGVDLAKLSDEQIIRRLSGQDYFHWLGIDAEQYHS